MTTIALRPDTTFVLHVNAFSHKVESGYPCHVFEGCVIAHAGPMLSGPAALAHLAAQPDTVIQVLHV